MKAVLKDFTQKLFSPVDAASLGFFRILFGALMFWQALYFLIKGRYIHYFIKPAFHFTYEGFSFVQPVGAAFLHGLLIVMAVSALGIMLGFFYRFSVFLFWITFSYIFLIDKVYYNNHYYFIILLSFLLLFVNAHRWGSLDQLWMKKPSVVPYWNLFLLKTQIFIVYFYGGLAKLNSDWLFGEPMRGWLQHVSHFPVVGPLLGSEWAPYFFSWGGAVFDLSIGFLLLWKRTRLFAFAAVLFFNLTNSAIFKIGVFPYLMIAATTLFDDPDWPRKMFQRIKTAPPVENGSVGPFQRRVVLVFLATYLFLQIVIPLRHWLYPGNVSWTEEGHLFSWHMKLRDKRGQLKIFITDPQTNTTEEVNLKEELNRSQIGKMVQRPPFIYQYVRHLKEKSERKGIKNPIIRVEAQISLNGRPYQQAIDPNVNLADVSYGVFSHAPWILPLDPQAKAGVRYNSAPEKEKEKSPEESESPL